MTGFIQKKRFRDAFIQSFKRRNRRDVERQPHRGRISPQAAVMGSANGKQAEDNIQSQSGEEKPMTISAPCGPRTNSTGCVMPNKIIQNDHRKGANTNWQRLIKKVI